LIAPRLFPFPSSPRPGPFVPHPSSFTRDFCSPFRASASPLSLFPHPFGTGGTVLQDFVRIRAFSVFYLRSPFTFFFFTARGLRAFRFHPLFPLWHRFSLVPFLLFFIILTFFLDPIIPKKWVFRLVFPFAYPFDGPNSWAVRHQGVTV